jgi:SLOG in TRPM, prokaryote
VNPGRAARPQRWSFEYARMSAASVPFPIGFEGGQTATAVRVDQPSDLPAALAALGLQAPRLVVVLIGGAGLMDARDLDRLRPLFERGLVPLAERLGLVVVDGGTDAGVMRLIGRARTSAAATFPLVGVPAVGTVRFPGKHWRARRRWSLKHLGTPRRWPLDAHHPHFVLVPGAEFGDEAPWIARVGTVLAGGWPSVTVLVNGGEIAYPDIECSLRAGRPVLAVAGSGRTADQLASAVRGGPADERAVRLAASGLVEVVDADDLAALDRALGVRLRRPV